MAKNLGDGKPITKDGERILMNKCNFLKIHKLTSEVVVCTGKKD